MTDLEKKLKNFKEEVEAHRESLRKRGRYGSSSDLYINEKAGVAVIGIQTSESGSGHDSIYAFKQGDSCPELVLDKFFTSGRMFPSEISKDGKEFTYTIKDESGDFHRYKHNLKTKKRMEGGK